MAVTVPSTRKWTIDTDARSRIDEVFSSLTNETPGCAVGVYRNEEHVFSNAYGMSNLEHGVSATPASIFHVASISKQFTAFCIALLAQEGRLNVDDPVHAHVPELPGYAWPITLRHLIHHVSGIRDQWVLLRMAGWRSEDLITEDDCFQQITRQRSLNFRPNDRYMYSNSGYTLLAIIVKRTTGQSLREFAHERIFSPLGMGNTHFHDDHSEIVKGRTQAYTARRGGGYHISIPEFDVVGTTSLFTTVEDFARWNGNFASGLVGGPDLLDLVQTPGTFNDGAPMEYAWGLSVDAWRGVKRVGHDGADHGYRSSTFRLPELDFGIAVFSNYARVAPHDLAERVAATVLGDALEPEPTPVIDRQELGSAKTSSHDLRANPSSISGTFAGIDDGERTFMNIAILDGVPSVESWDGPVDLESRSDGTFGLWNDLYVIGVTKVGTQGEAIELTATFTRTGNATTFNRIDSVTLDVEDLSTVGGKYYSDELDTWCEFIPDLETRSVILRQRKFRDRGCAWLDRDTFGWGALGSGWTIRFRRDDHGKVLAALVTSNRINDLEFSRVE